MRDPKLYTDCEGFPVVQVTLSSVEVGQIAMWLRRAGIEHSERMLERVAKDGDPCGAEAISDSNRDAGEWSMLHDLMEEPFWTLVNDGIPAKFPMYPGDEGLFEEIYGQDSEPTPLTVVSDNDEGE